LRARQIFQTVHAQSGHALSFVELQLHAVRKRVLENVTVPPCSFDL
jgi:hypothetical protein